MHSQYSRFLEFFNPCHHFDLSNKLSCNVYYTCFLECMLVNRLKWNTGTQASLSAPWIRFRLISWMLLFEQYKYRRLNSDKLRHFWIDNLLNRKPPSVFVQHTIPASISRGSCRDSWCRKYSEFWLHPEYLLTDQVANTFAKDESWTKQTHTMYVAFSEVFFEINYTFFWIIWSHKYIFG